MTTLVLSFSWRRPRHGERARAHARTPDTQGALCGTLTNGVSRGPATADAVTCPACRRLMPSPDEAVQ